MGWQQGASLRPEAALGLCADLAGAKASKGYVPVPTLARALAKVPLATAHAASLAVLNFKPR